MIFYLLLFSSRSGAVHDTDDSDANSTAFFVASVRPLVQFYGAARDEQR
jgi:hypothetical protein